MLKCNKPSEGRYQIRIIGNDINGNNINIIGSQQPLVVMEMELTVLPESAASLVSDAELYANDKYLHAREEELEKAYGAPKQKLTFDEYAALENMPQKSNYLVGSNHKYTLKWPMPWDDVTYSFDYNETRNYNMYTIASHSGNTAWHAAAAKHVNPDNSTGLYDRLYYKTMRLKQNPVKYGYFYYVNASADPGVMAKLWVAQSMFLHGLPNFPMRMRWQISHSISPPSSMKPMGRNVFRSIRSFQVMSRKKENG